MENGLGGKEIMWSHDSGHQENSNLLMPTNLQDLLPDMEGELT